ncbi:MAG TPA: hypothetical protein VEH29_03960 [Acidimicrobiales bacterium]|nr:hypothetical protein [Acidimicrobiales bacterium]
MSASRKGDEHGLGAPQPVAGGALVAPPEVVAAIAAAVEECWPRSRPRGRTGSGREPGAPEYVWRMSGRWWSKPVARRRDRPWSDHREHGALEGGGRT